MKRLPRLALAAALFAGALAGIPSLAFAGNLPAAIDGSVAVMHTNDIHGSYKYSYNASKGTGTVGFDGLAVLYSAQGNAPDLLLDAGDTFHGQSFATMSEGKSIAELMDTFYVDGYDATTPGNHDWSYGADKLRTMTGYSTTGTPFAMLCANAKSTSGVWSSSITKTLDRTWEDSEDHSTFDYKIKVGVVGAMDESLGSSLRADLVAGTSFSSAANAINAEAEQLRKEGCDVVVCIAHTLDAKTFATRLRGVDALIAGHEHINLNEKVTGADGKTIAKFGNICWYTNLDITKRHEDLLLYRRYKEDLSRYPKYDNYDAVEVSKVADIPEDYYGVMGVPITFMDKYNPDQFDIVAFRKGDDGRDLVFTRERERVQPYSRILVRRRR